MLPIALFVVAVVSAAPSMAPKCCFIAISEFNIFAPTSQVCSLVTGSGMMTQYSCPSGAAYHGKDGKFLTIEVPSSQAGYQGVSYVAQCHDASGAAVTSKAIHCDTVPGVQSITWDESIMGGHKCVETPDDKLRLVEFTPKTTGLKC